MTGNNPRILILTHCFPSDSADIPGNFLFDLSKHLSFLGAGVTIITQKMSVDYDNEYLSECGAKIEYFDWKGGDRRFAQMKMSSIKDLTSIISLLYNGRKNSKKLIKNENFDFILACWVMPAGLWSLSFRKNYNSAVWALGSDISVYGKKTIFRSLLRLVLSKSGIIFSNSFNHQKEIKSLFGYKSQILYTSRNLPKPDSIYVNSNKLRLVFIGRLEKIKGPDILISALINSGIENFELNFIGDGTLRKELESTVISNGLSGKIKFLGEKNASGISNYLIASDYLVISSRSESMPVVFWEAMQSSTPVLSTRVGDIEFYCDKYNVGRTCDPDVKSLSELLIFAYNFKPLRETLSNNTGKLSDLSNIKSSAKIIYDMARNKTDKKMKENY